MKTIGLSLIHKDRSDKCLANFVRFCQKKINLSRYSLRESTRKHKSFLFYNLKAKLTPCSLIMKVISFKTKNLVSMIFSKQLVLTILLSRVIKYLLIIKARFIEFLMFRSESRITHSKPALNQRHSVQS